MAMAKDPAMIYWLDSQLNTRTRPQENFGREIMELFSLGIGNYTEQDVYAAARVFTGFNWQIVGDRASTTDQLLHVPVPARTITTPTRRSSPSRSIRTAAGSFPRARRRPANRTRVDLIIALARHPATARRLATQALQVLRQRDVGARSGADQRDGELVPGEQLQHQVDAAHAVHVVAVPQSGQLLPALFVAGRVRGQARSRKPAGPASRSTARSRRSPTWASSCTSRPTSTAGSSGPGWISTSSMLARMNFASTLAANQRFNLARDAQPYRADAGARARIHAGAVPDDGLHGDARRRR